MYQKGRRPLREYPIFDLIKVQGKRLLEELSLHCSMRNIGREQFQKDAKRRRLSGTCKRYDKISREEPGKDHSKGSHPI